MTEQNLKSVNHHLTDQHCHAIFRTDRYKVEVCLSHLALVQRAWCQ